jgi:hypothetical protein
VEGIHGSWTGGKMMKIQLFPHQPLVLKADLEQVRGHDCEISELQDRPLAFGIRRHRDRAHCEIWRHEVSIFSILRLTSVSELTIVNSTDTTFSNLSMYVMKSSSIIVFLSGSEISIHSGLTRQGGMAIL